MDSNFDGLRRFFDKLKGLGFFDRLFAWSSVRRDLIGAYGELQRLISSAETLRSENSKLDSQTAVERTNLKNLQESNQRISIELNVIKEQNNALIRQNEERVKQIADLSSSNQSFLNRGHELRSEVNTLRQKIDILDLELLRLRNENGELKKTGEFKHRELFNALNSLTELQEGVKRDRERELVERKNTEIERLKGLKETWLNHESNVRQRMKAICSRHTIDYIEKVPFRGSPDNTLKINGEYVIFDAKSPAGDDLSNFNTYLKAQAENAIKYVKEEGVKRDIFLVVPSNTLEVIHAYEFRMADYTVYIVSLDSLEPVVITLQKIEQYEFADQLSPEERENICRVIGKFLHLSKRRIQIDGFFAKQFFELVYRSEAELPKDILEKVVEFERSEKLNPPTEKRAKQINLRELESDSEKLKTEATQKGIVTQEAVISRELNKLPLYATEEDMSTTDQGKLF